MSSFYAGSCRYQSFIRNYFPPRLHTTAEVLNFLKKYIAGTLEFNDNVEFGDALHPHVINESMNFLKNRPLTSNCKKFFMEICSNKVGYIGSRIVNANYASGYNVDTIIKRQTIDDIRNDILEIKYLLAEHFNIQDIYIITHVSIPLASGKIITEREELINQLRSLTDIVNIVDISAFLKTKYNTLEDIFPDSYHWSGGLYPVIHEFITKYLS